VRHQQLSAHIYSNVLATRLKATIVPEGITTRRSGNTLWPRSAISATAELLFVLSSVLASRQLLSVCYAVRTVYTAFRQATATYLGRESCWISPSVCCLHPRSPFVGSYSAVKAILVLPSQGDQKANRTGTSARFRGPRRRLNVWLWS